VVILDYHLDHSTGIDLFLEIKAQQEAPAINGILVTADRSEEVKRLADECGLVLLNKPVRPAALRALVSQFRKRAIAAE
jgi:DNA-binding response OmpR family regulator